MEANDNRITYPSEITFKSVFHNRPFLSDSITTIVSEYNITCSITSSESKKGSFLSITITASFESEEQLQRVCGSISSLEGFVMMF
jgi:putative lipoic acid-binding regulatory protein